MFQSSERPGILTDYSRQSSPSKRDAQRTTNVYIWGRKFLEGEWTMEIVAKESDDIWYKDTSLPVGRQMKRILTRIILLHRNLDTVGYAHAVNHPILAMRDCRNKPFIIHSDAQGVSKRYGISETQLAAYGIHGTMPEVESEKDNSSSSSK
ncbi:uncharacterized protein LOC117172479 [Belonocnema kinseyi]|uniref:uncharacterized protein LOC117172479 n=1 Tax=Belonocnema kinseyi TaxID=2817044 RepID=UPI00143D9455|nr:uncharacterized protein LOC117172479 [Belonocnema kinseyi]